MNELDKWAAEKCGVETFIESAQNRIMYYPAAEQLKPSSQFKFCREWTLEDPRCREIVREHFHIETWSHESEMFQGQNLPWCSTCPEMAEWCEGKTIAEAEMACIEAIWESERS